MMLPLDTRVTPSVGPSSIPAAAPSRSEVSGPSFDRHFEDAMRSKGAAADRDAADESRADDAARADRVADPADRPDAPSRRIRRAATSEPTTIPPVSPLPLVAETPALAVVAVPALPAPVAPDADADATIVPADAVEPAAPSITASADAAESVGTLLGTPLTTTPPLDAAVADLAAAGEPAAVADANAPSTGSSPTSPSASTATPTPSTPTAPAAEVSSATGAVVSAAGSVAAAATAAAAASTAAMAMAPVATATAVSGRPAASASATPRIASGPQRFAGADAAAPASPPPVAAPSADTASAGHDGTGQDSQPDRSTAEAGPAAAAMIVGDHATPRTGHDLDRAAAGLGGSAADLARAGAAPDARPGTPTRRPGMSRLDLDLSSEGLGPLRFRATTVGGQLRVALTAGDEHVRTALATHSAELRRDLESGGTDLAALDLGGHAAGQGHTSSSPHDPSDASGLPMSSGALGRPTVAATAAPSINPSSGRPTSSANSRLDRLL